jgi:hypothetical protein
MLSGLVVLDREEWSRRPRTAPRPVLARLPERHGLRPLAAPERGVRVSWARLVQVPRSVHLSGHLSRKQFTSEVISALEQAGAKPESLSGEHGREIPCGPAERVSARPGPDSARARGGRSPAVLRWRERRRLRSLRATAFTSTRRSSPPMGDGPQAPSQGLHRTNVHRRAQAPPARPSGRQDPRGSL